MAAKRTISIYGPGEPAAPADVILSLSESLCLRALDYRGPNCLPFARPDDVAELRKRGFISVDSDGRCRLTEAGRVIARDMPMEK